ncbi:hypothetical protein Taro_004608 [Colocasia esculenta]|uniref:Uncharacterized protein n=1 Tax=Colocasia esculenta TaxID=4460 RepID=A0A843TVG4_COLES|nr:hypothetical protein [Colocasia esculenta]
MLWPQRSPNPLSEIAHGLWGSLKTPVINKDHMLMVEHRSTISYSSLCLQNNQLDLQDFQLQVISYNVMYLIQLCKVKATGDQILPQMNENRKG